jgi:hypothetical protein
MKQLHNNVQNNKNNYVAGKRHSHEKQDKSRRRKRKQNKDFIMTGFVAQVTPKKRSWDRAENGKRSHNAQRNQLSTQNGGVLKGYDIEWDENTQQSKRNLVEEES